MAEHVGIVACSAEGAALCHRTLCAHGAHPEISMHTHSFAEYVKRIDAGNWGGVGELLLDSAHKLARSGATFLICPDNTVHQALPWIERRLPLPWLHIAEVVADEAVARGFRRVGLTGTRWLLEGGVYPEKLQARGLAFAIPDAEERTAMQRIIMAELVAGVFEPQSIAYFERVIDRLKNEGCDAVVLGCTEIPLIIGDANSSLPTLDSTRLLARAALERCRAIRIARADLGSEVGRALIGALNEELRGAYSEPGANHFQLDPEEVTSGRGAFLVVHRDGVPVGCGALRRLDSETAELKRMYVAPAARGTGLGRSLVAALEDEARALGVRRLVLETGVRQVAALALYRATGFAPIPLFGEYRLSPATSVCLGKDVPARDAK